MARPNHDRALRVLVAPDSFKGSLEAHEAAQHIAAGILQAAPGWVVTQAPMADGGEGTAKVVAASLRGAWHAIPVINANGDLIEIPFAVCRSSALKEFAIFDAAQVVGLPAARVAAPARTTRGIGQAVRAIAGCGYTTIVIGLGGSSTNDGGAGMLSELAYQFDDVRGSAFHPVLATLPAIDAVHKRPDAGWLAGIRLIALTDVTSPLSGPRGATQVFGAQKGVTDLEAAERALCRFAEQLTVLLNEDFSHAAGSGAAGGLGFAVRALGGSLRPGAEFILDTLGLNGTAMDFDWVITGEGRSDAQTLLGKVPTTIARLARARGIPVTLLSGAIEAGSALSGAFDGCFSVLPAPVSLDYAMQHAGPLLQDAAFNLARLFASLPAAATGPAQPD